MELVHHELDAEAFADELLALAAEAFAQSRILREAEQMFAQTARTPGLDEETGLALEAYLSCPIGIERDHGLGGGQGLRQRAGQTFPRGQVHENIHQSNQFRHRGRRHEASELKMALQ